MNEVSWRLYEDKRCRTDGNPGLMYSYNPSESVLAEDSTYQLLSVLFILFNVCLVKSYTFFLFSIEIQCIINIYTLPRLSTAAHVILVSKRQY